MLRPLAALRKQQDLALVLQQVPVGCISRVPVAACMEVCFDCRWDAYHVLTCAHFLDLVEAPEEIAWLDLSFNHIEEVTDDILE